MAKRHGNFHAMRAAGFTKASHQRAPFLRWTVLVLLAIGWIIFGLKDAIGADRGVLSDAIYRTLQALTMSGGFEGAGARRDVSDEVARFSGVAVTAIGLLFGFSSEVGRALARLWSLGAARHVVIAGDSAEAIALARSCRAAGDCVMLISGGFEKETAWSLRQSGIILVEGDPTHAEVLRSARTPYAAHLVALSDDDTENLRIEAALRALVKSVHRQKPLASHICIHAPLLLIEAREMRMLSQRVKDAAAQTSKERPAAANIDPMAFSMEEVSARSLLNAYGNEILDLAARSGRTGMHFVIFGFDAAAEAVAVRTLMSFWSVAFGAPRITIVTPDTELAASGFRARYPQAHAHGVWTADITFKAFDWRRAPIGFEFLDSISKERGEPSAVVVSTGVDGDNIQLALALLRTTNTNAVWAAPIFLHERMQSDFSQEFSAMGAGDDTGAYLAPFGGIASTATRSFIIDGVLDRGAAIAHRLYEENMMQRDVDMRALETVGKAWELVPETYRNANRAVVDSALVKLWDAGWKPVAPGAGGGDVHPRIEDDMVARLAEVEHGRWVAERLLSGWRPGPRNNRLMTHNSIIPWSELSESEKQKDADQVRAAAKVARALHPKGFVRRG